MTTSRQTPQMISLGRLLDNAENPRSDLGDLNELAASIRQHGIVQPIVATEHPTKPDHFLILAGHRRAAAALSIGLGQVSCVVRHDAGAKHDHIALMLTENMQRSNLTAVEKAKAMQKLIDHGMTQSEVARRLGITPASVNTYIMLLDLPEEELAQIEAGEVGLGDARAAIKRARRLDRHSAGQATRGRPVILEPRHFTDTHPLADTVRAICDHTTRYKLSGIGCGQCWEEAIREDAMVALVADEVAS